MTAEQSLLNFIYARLDEDTRLIMMNMPLVIDPDGMNPEFVERFIERSGPFHRTRILREVVDQVVAAMSDEQGSPPIPTERARGPVSALGSSVLKLIASQYGGHPDFNANWVC